MNLSMVYCLDQRETDTRHWFMKCASGIRSRSVSSFLITRLNNSSALFVDKICSLVPVAVRSESHAVHVVDKVAFVRLVLFDKERFCASMSSSTSSRLDFSTSDRCLITLRRMWAQHIPSVLSSPKTLRKTSRIADKLSAR